VQETIPEVVTAKATTTEATLGEAEEVDGESAQASATDTEESKTNVRQMSPSDIRIFDKQQQMMIHDVKDSEEFEQQMME